MEKLLTDLSFSGYLNIEIKTDKFNYPGIEKKLSELMTESKWPFIYIYSQMLNQIENKIGMKCSQLKADTYISVASIIDEELQAFTKK